MSTLAVKVGRIAGVEPHPNADRLDIVQVLDWHCVAPKGAFKKGDLCVYIPVDSVLPKDLEDHIFGPNAKVNLSGSRVRTIKLRGAISQGLVCTTGEIEEFLAGARGEWRTLELDDDITLSLGVKKYEPPPTPAYIGGKQAIKKQSNPNFRRYTEIENAKNYPGIFEPEDYVVVTEKIHGTNFRCGWVEFHASTWWKRFKQRLGLTPKWEFVYGSHNVQLHEPLGHFPPWLERNRGTGNVYAEIVKKYDLPNKLLPGEVLYGEIYGVQKGYSYGCKTGEHKLAVFDIMHNGVYVDYDRLCFLCFLKDLDTVPHLYSGPFGNREEKGELHTGKSLLDPSVEREGAVVRAFRGDGWHPLVGRKILKYVNPEYLLKEQTEYH